MTPIKIRKCIAIVVLVTIPLLIGLLAPIVNFTGLGILADAQAMALRTTVMGYFVEISVFCCVLYFGRAAKRIDCKFRDVKPDRSGELPEL